MFPEWFRDLNITLTLVIAGAIASIIMVKTTFSFEDGDYGAGVVFLLIYTGFGAFIGIAQVK